MIDFKDFANQLQQDVVSDMAESYFGDRKELDDMLKVFHQMAAALAQSCPKLFMAAARLHTLLLDQRTARDFYIALDILPSCIPFREEEARPFFDSLPFAFTLCGRYERCVFQAYSQLQQIADEYLNGKYYDDPESPGRKRLTVHYIRLKAIAEHINEKVDKINRTRTPSETLRYVKRMDIEQAERESVMGQPCLTDGCDLDKSLRFKPIDFAALELPVVQDLPRLDLVKPAIKTFCKGVCQLRKKDASRAMHSLLEGS